VYCNPYMNYLVQGSEEETVDSEEEENIQNPRQGLLFDSDADSEEIFDDLVDRVPFNNPVVSLPNSRAPSMGKVLSIIEEQELNPAIKKQRWCDISDAYI